MANILTTLFPAFAFLGIILFACDRQDKRKIKLEKVKAKAEWDRASECFRDDVTQEGFEEIVEAAGRSAKRLESLSVNGHKVYGTVASLSGISSWKFVIDFDYKGHLTSDHTVASSNDGSGIAERVADLTGMWRKKTRNEPSNILRVLKSSPEYWPLPFMSGDAWKGMSGSPLARRAPSYAAIESAMLSDWSCMTTVSR
ncbi:hypothetical protein I030019A5_07920 [Bifidobacterium bifidum]|nr:hypothetical protein [Bifidobacterium bifidum]KLN87084.1 hypothetical protein LMG11583_1342 [Bifidobacterium bifidum]MDB1249561.1 hypothetical protein [Bifidobacterium bifidum]MDB1251121.1 hypothetical protein [Bifidobacterium bifidum]